MSIEIKISKKRLSYKKAMLFLNKRVEEVKLGLNKELIWILEHPTTYTAGVSYSNKDIIDKKIKIVHRTKSYPQITKIDITFDCMLQFCSSSPHWKENFTI